MANYANPDVLVSTDWVQQHMGDPGLRIVEVDVDTRAYEEGHIPGAAGWNWQSQLQDPLRRSLATPGDFENLMASSGISNDTTVVLYGDNNNWFACWAFWQMAYYGHDERKLRVMNGGRKKWVAENRPLSREPAKVSLGKYRARKPDRAIRAFRDDVFSVLEQGKAVKKGHALVDVRSPDEFTGKILAPPGLNELSQRPGHIPGARNIPWGKAANDDGTFKSADELQVLYGGQGVTGDKDVIAYCRIGERSSHTWFVLKYLLGYKNVKNYDGSWTEWGNLIEAPIER